MVTIPAGEFLFGPDNEPRVLPEFEIDQYGVTNREWERFVKAGGASPPFSWSSWGKLPAGMADDPVQSISFDEAQAYAHWVGKDLPTEEEWEKAARGTDGRLYPWGDTWDTSRVSYYMQGHRIGGDIEQIVGIGPVGAHPQGVSPYGVHDMVGNALEWVKGAAGATPRTRIIKGGAVLELQIDGPETFRISASRSRNNTTSGPWGVGFRCVRRGRASQPEE